MFRTHAHAGTFAPPGHSSARRRADAARPCGLVRGGLLALSCLPGLVCGAVELRAEPATPPLRSRTGERGATHTVARGRLILPVAGHGNDLPADADDPDEGLKPIGALGTSIRMSEGEFPADVAAVRFATVPAYSHGYGARRGWLPSGFGWEAPAVFFKPLYFEDINLERYGIHQGCLQPAISFGHFFTRCACLPYKLLVQPPCECIYTLGYERSNNCIPLYCYCGLGCPSYEKWCQRCPCPVSPPCPWEPSEDGVCTDEDECP